MRVLVWPATASGQTPSAVPPDPYRNFVGSWSGTIPINSEKMPNTVKVIVSEARDGKSMRWDYVFGIKGENGYAHDAKWIKFDLAHLVMITHWKHKGELNFRTQGLATFIQSGFGAFSAEEVTQNGNVDRITFELQPDTLSYLWETSFARAHYSTYSKFEFTRDPAPGSTVSNKE